MDGLIQELKEILGHAWAYGKMNGYLEGFPLVWLSPDMNLKPVVPILRGNKARTFVANLPLNIQQAQRVLHLEVGKVHTDLIKQLVTIRKHQGLFAAYWGKAVHPTITLENDAPQSDRTALGDMAHDHTSYKERK